MPQKSAVETAAPSATAAQMWRLDPCEVTVIGYDTDDGPEHPLFDPRVKLLPGRNVPPGPEDEAMIQSIMASGVLQATCGRKNGPKLETIYGRRRTINCRIANERLVAQGLPPVKLPFVLATKAEERELLARSIIENELRKDDSLEVKASKAKRLMALGYSEKETAQFFGKPVSVVNEWLSFYDMDTTVQQAVVAGDLPVQGGVELSRKSREEQRAILTEAKGDAQAKGRAKVKIQDVRNVVRRAAGKDDLITKTVLRKVLALPGATALDPAAVIAFKIALGETPVGRLSGLTALVKEATALRSSK